jgi:hypothetical protein
MKQGEWEAPSSWHCINAAGTIVQVDSETRKEVEVWIKGLELPRDQSAQLLITSILGEDVTLFAIGLNVIYSTDPDQRCKQRQLMKLIDDEKLEQGFPED